MTLAKSLRPLAAEFLRTALPREFAASVDIEQGARELEAALLRIGVEAHEATVRGITFASAAQDTVNYPRLHMLHVGVRDVLTTVLDSSVAMHVERILDSPSPPIAEELLLALGSMAGSAEVPSAQASAAQFLLFEALRLNILAAEMLGVGSIAEDGGRPRDVDEVCELEVQWWVSHASTVADDVTPLRVLLVSALANLQARLEEVRVVLAQLDEETRADCARVAQLELTLREMDARDHLLLRNDHEIAEQLGEQRVGLQRLINTHPLAFRGMNRGAAYVRLGRLRDRIEKAEPVDRRGPALIDLVRGHLERKR